MAQRPVAERVEETPAAAPNRRGRDRRRHVLPDIWWDVESREIVFICIGYRNPACGPGFLRCLRVPDVLRGDEAIRALWRTPRKSPCPPKAVSGHHRSR